MYGDQCFKTAVFLIQHGEEQLCSIMLCLNKIAHLGHLNWYAKLQNI